MRHKLTPTPCWLVLDEDGRIIFSSITCAYKEIPRDKIGSFSVYFPNGGINEETPFFDVRPLGSQKPEHLIYRERNFVRVEKGVELRTKIIIAGFPNEDDKRVTVILPDMSSSIQQLGTDQLWDVNYREEELAYR